MSIIRHEKVVCFSALNSNLSPLLNAIMAERTFNSSSPLNIYTTAYSSIIVIGFVQGIGSVAILITRDSATITAKNLKTLSDFSSPQLTISLSGSNVVFTSAYSSSSKVLVIRAGYS